MDDVMVVAKKAVDTQKETEAKITSLVVGKAASLTGAVAEEAESADKSIAKAAEAMKETVATDFEALDQKVPAFEHGYAAQSIAARWWK